MAQAAKQLKKIKDIEAQALQEQKEKEESNRKRRNRSRDRKKKVRGGGGGAASLEAEEPGETGGRGAPRPVEKMLPSAGRAGQERWREGASERPEEDPASGLEGQSGRPGG